MSERGANFKELREKGHAWRVLRKVGVLLMCAAGIAILVANGALEVGRDTRRDPDA
jgi:hypothetical protein